MIRRRPPHGHKASGHNAAGLVFRVEDEHIEAANKPRNILEEIVWHKEVEIKEMRAKQPLVMLKQIIDRQPPARDWAQALRDAHERTGKPALIAEVKKASPSKGVIQPDFDPVRIARAYEKGGAACLSVLTDKKFFQGGFENLQYIRKAGVTCPLLCKEFVVEAYQVFMARAKGADAVLLIAAVLPDQDLTYLLKVIKGLGMTALIEVHTQHEMERVHNLEATDPSYCVLGINNRDLGTFKVDLSNTNTLLESEVGKQSLAEGYVWVGESGIFTSDDVAQVQSAGCRAILVGESLVREDDPATAVKELLGLE
jgi:indole-3-glycerol phosphate synthase